MAEYKLIIDKEDYNKIEEGEKNKFVKNILYEIGISFEEIWPDEGLTVEQKIKLRELLASYDLDVIEEDRGISVYHENQLIGRLNKPIYIKKMDPKAVQKSKKWYYEVIYDYWTAFDNVGE